MNKNLKLTKSTAYIVMSGLHTVYNFLPLQAKQYSIVCMGQAVLIYALTCEYFYVLVKYDSTGNPLTA